MNAPLTLAQVLPTWMKVKEEERKAIEHRRELDKMIQSLLPKQDEGSVSAKDGDYKVTVTYKLDRKLDTSSLQANWMAVPASAQAAVKWKADLSTTSFRALSDQDKGALSAYITTKPASPTVSVEFKEQ